MKTRPSSSSEVSVATDLSAAAGGRGEVVGEPVPVGIGLAGADANDTIVDDALGNVPDAGGAVAPLVQDSPLDVSDAVEADRSGRAVARMPALQVAAATATAEVAKSIANTATRRAKEQAATGVKFGRDRGSKASLAARSQGKQLAAIVRQQAARKAGELRVSDGQPANAAASNTALLTIKWQVRKGAEVHQRQATQLRRRRLAIIAAVAAIVGIAIGKYERRRRAACANLSESYDHDVTVTLPNAEPLPSEASAVQGITDAQ